jgi:pilus assembly protein Flp/PilA
MAAAKRPDAGCGRLAHAGGRPAAAAHVARPALIRLGGYLWGDRAGTTAIEYALIASMISIVIAASATAIGGTLNTFFSSVADGFQ